MFFSNKTSQISIDKAVIVWFAVHSIFHRQEIAVWLSLSKYIDLIDPDSVNVNKVSFVARSSRTLISSSCSSLIQTLQFELPCIQLPIPFLRHLSESTSCLKDSGFSTSNLNVQARNQRGEGGGGVSCPFSKTGKKCPNLEKKCPDCGHLG